MNDNNELTTAELSALVAKLSARVEALEGRITELQASRPVPEEDLLVIAATAAAYLGYKGKVKAVSYTSRTGWSAAGRRGRTTNDVRGTMPRAF